MTVRTGEAANCNIARFGEPSDIAGLRLASIELGQFMLVGSVSDRASFCL